MYDVVTHIDNKTISNSCSESSLHKVFQDFIENNGQVLCIVKKNIPINKKHQQYI